MTSSTLVDQLILKLGLYDEAHVKDKSTELIRLIDLKSSNLAATIGDYAKIVLCISLAADVLEIGIDQVNALKISGLKKSQYVNYKRMFEKVLDLNKPMGITEICIQLGLNEVAKKAATLLDFYKSNASDMSEEDLSHPQYAAMAVFEACKLSKRKISKAKILGLSRLRPTQWTLLEKQWDKLIEANPTLKTGVPAKKGVDIENTKEENKENGVIRRVKEPEAESYEDWRERILAKARNELGEMQGPDESMEDPIIGI